jgi:hypothetical protein
MAAPVMMAAPTVPAAAPVMTIAHHDAKLRALKRHGALLTNLRLCKRKKRRGVRAALSSECEQSCRQAGGENGAENMRAGFEASSLEVCCHDLSWSMISDGAERTTRNGRECFSGASAHAHLRAGKMK